MMISVRNYPKSNKRTGRLSVFKNRFGGNIREERRFVPYSFNGENAEEKNQADLRTAEEGLAAITENLALLEERLAGFGDIPVMETDEKVPH